MAECVTADRGGHFHAVAHHLPARGVEQIMLGCADYMDSTQLDHYFARIAYHGPREPSLPVLNALTAAHVHHIPFENLDVLLGRPIELSPDALERNGH